MSRPKQIQDRPGQVRFMKNLSVKWDHPKLGVGALITFWPLPAVGSCVRDAMAAVLSPPGIDVGLINASSMTCTVLGYDETALCSHPPLREFDIGGSLRMIAVKACAAWFRSYTASGEFAATFATDPLPEGPSYHLLPMESWAWQQPRPGQHDAAWTAGLRPVLHPDRVLHRFLLLNSDGSTQPIVVLGHRLACPGARAHGTWTMEVFPIDDDGVLGDRMLEVSSLPHGAIEGVVKAALAGLFDRLGYVEGVQWVADSAVLLPREPA